MKDDFESSRVKRIGLGIFIQVLIYTFITLAFFLTVYNDRLVYFFSMMIVFILSVYLFFNSRNSEKAYIQILSWIFLVISLILMFSPINYFYEFIGKTLFQKSFGIGMDFDWMAFWMFFGILTALSVVAELIIGLYYYFKDDKTYPVESGYGMWDYFLKDTDYKKLLLLIALLSVASIVEEIAFRFAFFNILLLMSFPLFLILIISSLAFGLAHYQNGGWIYCVNSTMAGFIFGWCFIVFGVWMSWLCHFFWNFVIIFQMFLPKLYERETTPQSIVLKD